MALARVVPPVRVSVDIGSANVPSLSPLTSRPPAQNEEWRLDRLLQRKAQQGVKIYVVVYKEVTQTMTMGSKHTKARLRVPWMLTKSMTLVNRRRWKRSIPILRACVTPIISVAKVCHVILVLFRPGFSIGDTRYRRVLVSSRKGLGQRD